jgi:hypothetical protein
VGLHLARRNFADWFVTTSSCPQPWPPCVASRSPACTLANLAPTLLQSELQVLVWILKSPLSFRALGGFP